MPDYKQFYEDVKKSVGERLACFNLSDQELDDYLKREESQIRGEYEGMLEDSEEKGDLTPEAHYASCVDGIAMCLEYCY